MTPERWQHIKELVAPALEMGPTEQALYIERACAGDASLGNALANFLAAERESRNSFLNSGQIMENLDTIAHEPFYTWIGRRLGAYQIVEKLGSGGMGEVYSAFRADDEYQKRVAIKVVRVPDPAFIHRFRNERQILAVLDHPNIARLLDGGTTPSGIPYLVMELIEGLPIDQYSDVRKLKLTERLVLFLQVCASVQYAHRHLIIHRDIKPRNILVTSDGVAKLLDFGIAKVLDPSFVDGQFEPTGSIFRALTPGYASPEQVMNGTITTASDVYSLGVVLYELLSGHSPYIVENGSPQEIARAVCEDQPEKPSGAIYRTEREQQASNSRVTSPVKLSAARQSPPDKLQKGLEGDLDNIVLMALRKEPERRYSSVEQLARDIEHHLEHLPVLARKDTVGYRSSRFLARHRTAVAAAAISVLMLVVGLVLTMREAHIARQQAQIAETQRARAERNFADIRELSNSLMFGIHDSIQDLPGATPARKMLVDSSLKYLDRLAKESGEDASLQRELATAYERVAAVQGNPFGSNLGDLQGAAANYRKAVAIWESLLSANSQSVRDVLGLSGAYRQLAGTVANGGGGDPFELLQKAFAVSHPITGFTDPRIAEELELDYEMAAAIQVKSGGDPSGALENHRKSLTLAERRLKTNPEDPLLQRRVANIRMRMGESLGELGKQEEALEEFRLGFERFEADPEYPHLHRDVARLLWKWGDVLMMGGDTKGALRRFQQAQELLESLARPDPQNSQVRLEVALTSARVDWALSWQHDGQASLAMFEKAKRILEPMAHNPQMVEAHSLLALSHIWMGEFLGRTGNNSKALKNYQEGVAEFGAVVEFLPWDRFYQSSLAASHSKAGRILARIGRDREASAEYRRAVEIARPLATSKPDSLPWYTVAEASFGMGHLSERMTGFVGSAAIKQQHWITACNWYHQSTEAWQRIPNRAVITSAGFDVGNPTDTAKHLAVCEAVLQKISPHLPATPIRETSHVQAAQ